MFGVYIIHHTLDMIFLMLCQPTYLLTQLNSLSRIRSVVPICLHARFPILSFILSLFSSRKHSDPLGLVHLAHLSSS